jgi:hypothetical protein
MKITKSLQQFISDAQSLRFTVVEGKTSLRIFKMKGKKIDLGVVIWEDGTIYRTDIPASISINMRSQKAARKYLGVTK